MASLSPTFCGYSPKPRRVPFKALKNGLLYRPFLTFGGGLYDPLRSLARSSSRMPLPLAAPRKIIVVA